MIWFVYIILCQKDNSYYTGITNNLAKRLEKHSQNKGAKYTKNRGPFTLLKSFVCPNKSEALKLEYRIKQLSKEKKLTFNPPGYIMGKPKTKEKMKNNFTAINVILDSSGSMAGLASDTLGSFNTFLAEQKAVEGEVAFTLCTFNSDYRLVHDFVKLNDVADLDKNSYKPSGGTALLDAMGATIDAVGKKLAALPEEERPSKVLTLVITDGHENASHHFSRAKIKEMVEHQKNVYNWDFLFFGANIDAITAGSELGLDATTSINYSASVGGTKQLYRSVSNSVSSYRAGGPLTVDPSSLVDNNSPIDNTSVILPAVGPNKKAKRVK